MADLDQQIFDHLEGVGPERIEHIKDALDPVFVDLGSDNNRSPGTEIAVFGNDILEKTPRRAPYAGVGRILYDSRQEPVQWMRMALGRFFVSAKANGLELENIAILATTGRGVAKISAALNGGAKPIPHKVLFDEKESKVIAQGKRGSVQKELETSPGLSPARLQLINTRTIVDPALPRTEQHTQSIGRQDTMGNTARREGRRAANSIRPICRAFLRFPYDRHLSLEVPGVAPNTYQTAFKKLRSDGLGQFAQARVFYGELAWSQAVESSEYLTISLNAGEWKDEKLTPYQVIVHWLEWSAVARGRLKNELEVARKEGMEAKKAKQASRSFLFFIGNQDAKKPALFHVQDHRLICTLHDELVFPAYSRTARR
ncbi:hypothetical protein KUT41_15675 [Pseudomonas aeruginosa]|nr:MULTISPECIES: hypothetical protein [Pseudomonas aeruginosa group]EKL8245035.1 hypothetical protein [Pseudomonas aeruginosa]EKL8603074.1 hypothetical protein [Pseudomonas aeruginosa]EKT0603056.1 hypothetical protein [Pseudomonas aeruginosa]EKU5839221.1 hypothetical protein [Pseudomonas aeruginosa]EKW7913772.1 hypothetical protein [Pseudomonas aeruginosa]